MYPFKEKQKQSPMDMKILRRTREKEEGIQLGMQFFRSWNLQFVKS
jgi:hypothetical protein